ncbi:hypothetical protein MMC28_007369 [Mycoblastus sanguinarius]|nr:hypothetical protein [Mycoblastus sanguinarius]
MPSPGALDEVPPELLRMVLELLSRKDLYNLRLTSKSLASAAALSLFHTITIWLGLKSLEGLTGISEHHHLSQYVRKIIFCPLRFVEFDDESEYTKKLKDWLEYDSSSLNSHAPSYGRHLSAYKSYMEAQKYLTKHAMDVKILSRALRGLPQLESIVVDPWNDHIGSTEIHHAFGTSRLGDFLTKDGLHALPVLIQALSALERKTRYFRIGEDEELWYNISRNSTPPNHLAASLPTASFPKYPARLSGHALARTFSTRDRYGYRAAFRELRTLEITEVVNDD